MVGTQHIIVFVQEETHCAYWPLFHPLFKESLIWSIRIDDIHIFKFKQAHSKICPSSEQGKGPGNSCSNRELERCTPLTYSKSLIIGKGANPDPRCTRGRDEQKCIWEPLFTPKNLLVYAYTLDLISGVGQREIPDFRGLIWTVNQLSGGFDFRGRADRNPWLSGVDLDHKLTVWADLTSGAGWGRKFFLQKLRKIFFSND